MKHQILSEAVGKLNSLGLSIQSGNGTDLTIATEFLDAGWSTGSKKINYEAHIFADERENTVFMYEKTTEIGHGLSFGQESGSSFQSGKTLLRKVKSIQYGPDGKAYEYTLDLGSIPKSVKEIAQLHGWKFKTVIDKKKALYPIGYVPTGVPPVPPTASAPTTKPASAYCSNCGMPLPEGTKFCNHCGKPISTSGSMQNPTQSPPKNRKQTPEPFSSQTSQSSSSPKPAPQKSRKIGMIGSILLGVLLLLLLFTLEVSPFGWIFSVLLYAFSFFLQLKLSKRGCFLRLVLWIFTAIFLVIFVLLFSPDTPEISSGLSAPKDTPTNVSSVPSANPATTTERNLVSFEMDIPEGYTRVGDTALGDTWTFHKDLYQLISSAYIGLLSKVPKEVYNGTVEGFEQYFISRDETHTLVGTPELRTIGEWQAVRCMVKLMPTNPNFYFYYFIDVEGENDICCYVLSTDEAVSYKLGDEWEAYWATIKLIY